MALERFSLAIAIFLLGMGAAVHSASDPATAARAQGADKIAPWVMQHTAGGEEAEFLVILRDQADVRAASRFPSRRQKGRFVRDALWEKAQATQKPLLNWLRARKIPHRPFYIVNMVWVKANRDIIAEIAARPEVARIEGNPEIHNPLTVTPQAADMGVTPQSTAAIEPGINYVRAPALWAMGFTGQGIVIGSADTGVQWDHPALISKYRGYNGVAVNHDYNWHDSIHSGGGDCGPDSPQPCDDNNHGTHTTGTAVGDDGAGNQIGMAPGAKFIACRNMDRGVGTPASYAECFEFFLAPYPVGGDPSQGNPDLAPDVTINSWACPPSEGCSPLTLQAALEAQRAAGIMTVAAAGNEGSGCATVADPPALYDAAYTVGAFSAATGAIASFSSRGPVTADQSNRIKPDITAPGVGVRSSVRGGGYASLSGTSMATPHVAGAVALLWSARPVLRRQMDLTEAILNESAVDAVDASCGSASTPNNVYGFGRLDVRAALDIQLEPVVTTGLSSPIFVTNAGDGSNRLFIVEQGGIIKVLQPGASTPTEFLNITSKVLSGGERGLLGLAFHPFYKDNGRFFVNYTRQSDGATVIAEYHVSESNPNVADTTETVILVIPQPFANHNGGMIAFGPDGYLYIGMGDGGSANDPGNRAQNINDLLGKILRIDIDHPNSPNLYSSPSSNPFFGSTAGADEIYAVGLRNPWRFSFDRDTGTLYAGDVGQSTMEEVDVITLGGNYGWRVFEGTLCTGLDPALCASPRFTPPIAEYRHNGGRCSITGGYVYRGPRGSLPVGAYVYGDYCTGEIFLLENGLQSVLMDTSFNISSFGEDEAGEIYVVAHGGSVHRIANPNAPCTVSVLPESHSYPASGGSGAIQVVAPTFCGWTAATSDSFITITQGASGAGYGVVTYTVAENTAATPRTGTITIAGQPFTVNQEAASSGANYEGFVDYVGCDFIGGWAADRNRLNTSISVSLYDGDTLIATVLANGSRPDVGAYLGDNGLHGFAIPTPNMLRTGTHTVRVRFESSSQDLIGSPRTITCGNPNYEGYVDYLGCDFIGGWAADHNRLNTSITVSLYDGAMLVATVQANQHRPDVGAYLGDNGLHGFTIPTPAALRGGTHAIYLRFEGSAQDLGGSPQTLMCSSANYAGYVDYMDCGVIAGWAADRNRLNTPITVSIYDGTLLIATVTADQSRPDVGAHLGDNGLHGFSVAMPSALRGGTHAIYIRFEGSNQDLSGSPRTLTCSSASYEGYVDYLGCDFIGGWAADHNRLNTSITVSLYDGSTLLATVTANGSRPDVGTHLGDNGLHGFTIPTPPALRNSQLHTVRIRFEGSGMDLGSSPRTLICSQ